MDTFENISLSDAKILINSNNSVIVDIRDPESFKSGHIEGAIHLSNDNLHDFIRDSDLETPVIVCCYHGHSSQSAAQFLLEQGFDTVYSLIGGYSAWSAEAMC